MRFEMQKMPPPNINPSSKRHKRNYKKIRAQKVTRRITRVKKGSVSVQRGSGGVSQRIASNKKDSLETHQEKSSILQSPLDGFKTDAEKWARAKAAFQVGQFPRRSNDLVDRMGKSLVGFGLDSGSAQQLLL
jgi:hypothetical protein